MIQARRARAARLRALAAALALAGAPGLAGCISILPKATPAQLYRFGAGPAPPRPPAADGTSGTPAPVLLDAVILPRLAAGDGLLTVTGDQVAYVAGARWAAPAVVLFSEATQRAFSAEATRTRLAPRGAPGRASAVLRLTVSDFQVDYGPSAATAGIAAAPAPTVEIALHAQLTRPDGTTLAETEFTANRGAGENRVSAIIPAYDSATAEVLKQLVAWTDAQLARAGASAGTDEAPVRPAPARPRTGRRGG